MPQDNERFQLGEPDIMTDSGDIFSIKKKKKKIPTMEFEPDKTIRYHMQLVNQIRNQEEQI